MCFALLFHQLQRCQQLQARLGGGRAWETYLVRCGTLRALVLRYMGVGAFRRVGRAASTWRGIRPHVTDHSSTDLCKVCFTLFVGCTGLFDGGSHLMGLPSLDTMVVGGGVFPLFACFLPGGRGLRTATGGGVSWVCKGVLFFLSQVVFFMHQPFNKK